MRDICNKELTFYFIIDSSNYKFFNKKNDRNKLKINDTITDINWYLTDNLGCIRGQCFHGTYSTKLLLNQSSNTLVFNKIFCSKDTLPERYIFKVIKFSGFEVILQDLKKLPYKRYYYFQTKYSK